MTTVSSSLNMISVMAFAAAVPGSIGTRAQLLASREPPDRFGIEPAQPTIRSRAGGPPPPGGNPRSAGPEVAGHVACPKLRFLGLVRSSSARIPVVLEHRPLVPGGEWREHNAGQPTARGRAVRTLGSCLPRLRSVRAARGRQGSHAARAGSPPLTAPPRALDADSGAEAGWSVRCSPLSVRRLSVLDVRAEPMPSHPRCGQSAASVSIDCAGHPHSGSLKQRR
jgi:hypothetical protein